MRESLYQQFTVAATSQYLDSWLFGTSGVMLHRRCVFETAYSFLLKARFHGVFDRLQKRGQISIMFHCKPLKQGAHLRWRKTDPKDAGAPIYIYGRLTERFLEGGKSVRRLSGITLCTS